MIEIRGDKKVLITPVSAEDLKDIHIGDIVWLDSYFLFNSFDLYFLSVY